MRARLLLPVLITIVLAVPGQSLAAGDIFRGKELYQQKCASCHGVDGKPMMLGIPDFSRGEAVLKTYEELAQVVKTGRGMMPGFQSQMKEQDVFDIVAYIKTLF